MSDSPTEATPPLEWLRRAVALLGSLGLASVLFVALLALTYAGTLDQIERGLLHAQDKYFHAYIVVVDALGLPIPLPGALTLMGLLAVNIALGAFKRFRRNASSIGLFLVHGGILVLLAGGMAGHYLEVRGSVLLREGESADAFQSETEWTLLLCDAKGGEHKLPLPQAVGSRVMLGDTVVTPIRFEPHARPLPAMEHGAPNLESLEARDIALENTAGVLLRVERADAPAQEVVAWAGDNAPIPVAAADGTWSAGLRRKSWPLPFELTLTDFERRTHPGTDIANHFRSEFLRQTDGDEQRAVVSMNAPMRYAGYTIYQDSWGPQGAAEGVPLYSVLTVARNPAERVPLYACALVALGMVLHFATRLARYAARRPEGGDA